MSDSPAAAATPSDFRRGPGLFRLARNRAALVAGGVIGLVIVAAVLGPMVSPFAIDSLDWEHMAFCPVEQRESLLEILRRSTHEVDKLAHDRPELDKILDDTRERGYASAVHTRRVSDEISIAVPVLSEDQVLATVVVRFAETAVPLKTAAERFVPRLRDAATRILQTFVEQQLNPPYPALRPIPAR
jgi:hypothetical protein